MGGEGGVYFGDVLNKNTFLTDIVSVFEFSNHSVQTRPQSLQCPLLVP